MTEGLGLTSVPANLDQLVAAKESFTYNDVIAALHNQEVVAYLQTQNQTVYQAAHNDESAVQAASSRAEFSLREVGRSDRETYIETDTNVAEYSINDSSSDAYVLDTVAVNRGSYSVKAAWVDDESGNSVVVGDETASFGNMNVLTYNFTTPVKPGSDRIASCQISVDPDFNTGCGNSGLFYVTCDMPRVERRLEDPANAVEIVNGLRASMGLPTLTAAEMASLVQD